MSGTLGLLVVAFLATPYAVAWFGPGLIAERAAGRINGSVTVGSIDWWWGKPFKVTGVQVRLKGDPASDPPALEVAEAQIPIGLGSLLLNDRLVVDGMMATVKSLSLRRRTDGSWNWEHLIAGGGRVPMTADGRVPTSTDRTAAGKVGDSGHGGGTGNEDDRSAPAPTEAATGGVVVPFRVIASGTVDIDEFRISDDSREGVSCVLRCQVRAETTGIEEGVDLEAVLQPAGAAEGNSVVHVRGTLGMTPALSVNLEWEAPEISLARYADLVDTTTGWRPDGVMGTKGKIGYQSEPRRLSGDVTVEMREVSVAQGGRVPMTASGRVPTSTDRTADGDVGDSGHGGDTKNDEDRSAPAPAAAGETAVSSDPKPETRNPEPDSVPAANPPWRVPDLTLTLIAATGEDGTLSGRITAARPGMDLAAAVTVARFDTPAPSADLTGHGLIDVGQIDPATRDLLDIRTDVAIEGLLTLDARAEATFGSGAAGALQAETGRGTVTLALDNFAVRDPDGARRPLEPALRAEVAADYDRAAGRCTVTRANLKSEAIVIEAHGSIEGLGPAPDGAARPARVADSKVTAHADLDRLQRQCASFLRWAVDTKLAGTLDVRASLSGSAAEAGGSAVLEARDLHLTNIPVAGTRRSLGPMAARAELEGTLAFSPDGVSRLTRAVITSDPVDGEATATIARLFDPAGGADLTLDTTFTLRPERVMATLGDWIEGIRLSGDPVTIHIDTRGTASESKLKVTLATVQAAITGGPLAERTLTARDASLACEASLNRTASKAIVERFTWRSQSLDFGFAGTLDAGAAPPRCDGTFEWKLRPDAAAADLRTWLPDWEFRGEILNGVATYAGTSEAGKGKCITEGGLLALRRRGEAVDRLKADHFGAQLDGAFDRAADRLSLAKADFDTEWAGATVTADLEHLFAFRSDDADSARAIRGKVGIEAEGDAGRMLAAVRGFLGPPAAGEASGRVKIRLPVEAKDGAVLYDLTVEGKEVGATDLAFGETKFDAAPGEVLLRTAGQFTPGREWSSRTDAFEWRGAGTKLSGSGSCAGSGAEVRSAEAKFSGTLGPEPIAAFARRLLAPEAAATGRPVAIQGTARRDGAGWSLTSTATAPELSVTGGRLGAAGVQLREARLELDAAYDPAPGVDRLTLSRCDLVTGTTAATIHGRLDHVSVPKEMAADGTLTFSGEVPALLRDFPGLFTRPEGTRLSGRLNVDAGIRGKEGALTFAGAVSCTDFEFVSPELKDRPIREARVGLDIETSLTFEPFAADIRRGTLSAETMHGTLTGGLTVHPDAYEFRRFALDLLYVPDRLGPILAAFVPGTLAGKEEQPLKLLLDGRMTGAELRARLREATASVQIGFGSYTLEGLRVSGAPLTFEVRNGRMPLRQSLGVNQGTMTLGGMVDFREVPTAGAGAEPVATQVSMKLENVQIHQDMGALLSRINPIFYTVGGTLEGSLSSDLAMRYDRAFTSAEEFRRAASGDGTVGIQNLKITGSPLLGEILMQLGTAAADAAGTGKMEPIALSLRNGRLSYSQMTVMVGGTVLHFRGSVGLDDSLDLEMGFPFSQGMLNRNPALADWLGAELWVPIRGRVASPRVEWDDLFRGLLKQAAQRAAAKALERLLGGDKEEKK